jgi:hypothetical protein
MRVYQLDFRKENTQLYFVIKIYQSRMRKNVIGEKLRDVYIRRMDDRILMLRMKMEGQDPLENLK